MGAFGATQTTHGPTSNLLVAQQNPGALGRFACGWGGWRWVAFSPPSVFMLILVAQ